MWCLLRSAKGGCYHEMFSSEVPSNLFYPRICAELLGYAYSNPLIILKNLLILSKMIVMVLIPLVQTHQLLIYLLQLVQAVRFLSSKLENLKLRRPRKERRVFYPNQVPKFEKEEEGLYALGLNDL